MVGEGGFEESLAGGEHCELTNKEQMGAIAPTMHERRLGGSDEKEDSHYPHPYGQGAA
jgi:hypothetical protein